MSTEQVEFDSIELAEKLSAIEIAQLCLGINGYILDSVLDVPRLHNRKYIGSLNAYFKILGEIVTSLMRYFAVSPCRRTEKTYELTLFRMSTLSQKAKFEYWNTMVGPGLPCNLHPLISMQLLFLISEQCIYALISKINGNIRTMSKVVRHVSQSLEPLLQNCVSTMIPEPLDNPKYELVCASVKIKFKEESD